MTTENRSFLLPGFSAKGRTWADTMAQEIQDTTPTTVHYWEHWSTEVKDPQWIEKEVEKLKQAIGNSKVNLIVKSAGTLVGMRLLEQDSSICRKIILCGVPLLDLTDPKDQEAYQILKQLPAENILVFQNENDNHGSFEMIQQFIHKINPDIKVISKPRDDHEYPYPEDFKQFLI